MAQIITMPRLSDTMTDGTVALWLKKIGDSVTEGDILAEIETDKATMEFESFHSGTLLYIGVQQGETAPVDSILAIIGEKNEDISSLLNKNNFPNTTIPSIIEKTETEPNDFEIPDQIKIITMPRLSDTMTEGTVASWIKKEGDNVKEGDILAEIETDKATMEFEAFHSGTLLYIGVQEGHSAPVDSVLAIIGEKEIDISGVIANLGKQKTQTILQENQTTQTNKAEDITNTDNKKRIFVSPLAKKIASENGINLLNIKGTGENGRIIKMDVENFMPSVSGTTSTQTINVSTEKPTIISKSDQETYTEVKNSQMRKIIAKRLSESKFTAPHYYLNVEINMENAIASRSIINKNIEAKISFNDMIIKAVALALKKHPKVNSQWKDETTILSRDIHIGVAVAVADGLVVPVLKYADELTLSQIGVSVKDLVTRSRNKKIQPNEMEGSTFTVSNLGMFGIESFTSIINQPNSAILSVGTIVEKPVIKDGQIVVGNTMKLTLACDHRTVDGVTGAEFLQTLVRYIENPIMMLV